VKQHDEAGPDLSLVIPAYNEALRLPTFLERLDGHLKVRGKPYEVIVVDDGSRDDTAAVVTMLSGRLPHIKLIQSTHNAGKGAAVRLGMREARGRLRLFADADGATAIEELTPLEQTINKGADIAIGSRTLASWDSRYTVLARRHRSLLGAIFNAVVQRLGLDGIHDTQCGFKLFRRQAAEDLFSVGSVDGYGFDLELLYIAKHRGYRIAEVPVNWADQPGSKVRPVRDGLAMLFDLLAVRRRAAQGRYDSHYPTPAADLLNPIEPTPVR
jgi:dolichyl-phosphate beta-glucosyltransferase